MHSGLRLGSPKQRASALARENAQIRNRVRRHQECGKFGVRGNVRGDFLQATVEVIPLHTLLHETCTLIHIQAHTIHAP